jgi:dUTPase
LTPSTSDIGFILHSPKNQHINPGKIKCIKTGIGITTPDSKSYWRVSNHKSNSAFLKICAGVIDSDYRGEIGIVVKNISNQVYNLQRLNPIANIICEKIFIEDFSSRKEDFRCERSDLSLDFSINFEYHHLKPYTKKYEPHSYANGYGLPLEYDVEIQAKSTFEWKIPIRIVEHLRCCCCCGYWFVASISNDVFVLNDILDDSIIFYNGSNSSVVLLAGKCYVSIHYIEIEKPMLKYVKNFNDKQTVRGENGFGSTGVV